MSSDGYPPNLTLAEKLDLIPAFLYLIASWIYAAISGAFRGHRGAKCYGKHVKYTVIRKFLQRISTRQNQYLNPPTNVVYETFAKSKGFIPQTVVLDHGGLGHWMGNKDANNVLVYYHGGGFALPANICSFQFFSDILDELNAAGKDTAMFFLTYTLTPHATYPVQMKQAVEALRYIMREVGRRPSNVIMGGDSAGGNLALAVLSHLSNPHEEIQPLEISEPLSGIFAIAPWISFSGDFPSVQENEYKDTISGPILSPWSSAYLAGRAGDNYSEALAAPIEWWKDAKVKDALFVAGRDEVLVSSIEQFVEKFKSAVPNTIFIIGEEEPHDAPIVYRILNDRTETQQGNAIKSWLLWKL